MKILPWIVLGALLLWSFSGAIYFSAQRRAARPDWYALYIWVCVAGFDALPIATGDWGWSIVAIPFSVLVGRMIISRQLNR